MDKVKQIEAESKESKLEDVTSTAKRLNVFQAYPMPPPPSKVGLMVADRCRTLEPTVYAGDSVQPVGSIREVYWLETTISVQEVPDLSCTPSPL